MVDIVTKYAVLSRRAQLTELDANLSSFQSERQGLTGEPGTLLQIIRTQPGANKLCTVQVLDFVYPESINEKYYEVQQSLLLKVDEILWPYVINIENPERRLRMLLNPSQCNLTLSLTIKDLVCACISDESLKMKRFDCIVRFIGPVRELHPVGLFFGLEILNLDQGHSPQADSIPYAQNYMGCDPALSIFTTADNLSPLEGKKKPSTLDVISETFNKAVDAVVGSNYTSKTSYTRKEKYKEPTARFYDTACSPCNEVSSSQEQTAPKMEKKPPNTKKNTETDSHKGGITTENEDFSQSILNYEKRNLERQHAGNTLTATATAPAGILKHRPTSNGFKDDLNPKSLRVMNKSDNRESTKLESELIVVDNQNSNEVDLVDVLGGNWPNVAGDAASMLNKTQRQQQIAAAGGSGGSSNSSVSSFSQTKNDRNKSANPIAHFNPSRTLDTKKQRYVGNTTMVGSNSNDFGRIDANKINERCITNGSPIYDNLVDVDDPILKERSKVGAADVDDFVLQGIPFQEVPGSGLGLGSMVAVNVSESSQELYGVVRWIGVPPAAESIMVGVELEDEPAETFLNATNGKYNGVPLFKCHDNRALFVTPSQCAIDPRFLDSDRGGSKSNTNTQLESKLFGQVECPSVPGAIAPLKIFDLKGLEGICGKFKGIQGHHNSCYLDATLFSMFSFTSVFDSLLFRPAEAEDIQHYEEVQKVLREEIVNPLRKNIFVRADRVMKLRQLLDKLSSVSGLTSEEKDPEEFLNSLLAQIMRVEPFLKLSSGQDAYFYQLFVEKDERLSFPNVQQLFEQSFFSSDIKLTEVPSCLIIQMPRFGKNYKMYPRILPSQVLDVTDIIEDSPRQCSVCGKLAEYECRECFGKLQKGVGLESTGFCRICLDRVHMHSERANHTRKKLAVPHDFRAMAEHMNVPRLYMELFAVVCIETSHYVAFVKASCGPDAPWCFFDSMADRKGEKNGYNIPELITVPDLPLWLSEDGARTINETSSNDKMLPEHAKRLFCDAYMCMYQSTDVMMYR